MVRQRLMDDGLVEDEIGLREAFLDIAHLPFCVDFAHRELVVVGFERLSVPLDRTQEGLPFLAHEAVAANAGVRTTGSQAVEWVDDERQRLEVDLDALDCLGGGGLVDRRDGQDCLALVERLHGEGALGVGVVVGRQILRGDDALDAGHAQRGAGVDASDASVRHRARQNLGEEHAFGAEVLRVPSLAGDLRHQVGRYDVLADELPLTGHQLASAGTLSRV